MYVVRKKSSLTFFESPSHVEVFLQLQLLFNLEQNFMGELLPKMF